MEVLSVLYLLVYALSGISIARYVFNKEHPVKRVFFGLVFGLAMLLWLPTIFSFILSKFNLLSQLLGLAAAIGLGVLFFFLHERKRKLLPPAPVKKEEFRLRPFLLTVIPLLIVGWTLLINHTITTASDGSLHVGQCTYGDLCMHLGFISSISTQQTFPPDYSILPGTALGYPFLCDSVSSTFYTLGSSLRFAAILPALYAYLVVVLGVYFFFDEWFKNSAVTVLATYMFFVGGGLGFAYIFNNKKLLADAGIDRWSEMLNGFYKTPTNLPDEGLRWVNTIADMLVPQRATLFGWALLFPCLQLLYRAAIEKQNKLFIPLGILAGCLPLVHTHSFLALALVSIVLFVSAVKSELLRIPSDAGGRLCIEACMLSLLLLVTALLGKYIGKTGYPAAGVLAYALVAVLAVVILIVRALKERKNPGGKAAFDTVIIAGVLFIISGLVMVFAKNGSEISLIGTAVSAAIFLFFLFYCIFGHYGRNKPAYGGIKGYFMNDEGGSNLLFFIIFGAIAVLLSMPQVFGFTLKQASNDSFLRWNFNWDNNSDSYLWFYIKNLGLIFIFMLPAFLTSDKKTRLFYGGGLLIWLICEIMCFQPNRYDNNKLLFIWFAMTCGIVSSYLIGLYKKLNRPEDGGKKLSIGKRTANKIIAFAVLVAIFLSGTLTLYREYISADHIGFSKDSDGKLSFGMVESGYTVNTAEEVKLCEWIKANTEPDAVILSYNNHNNAIAMLTGRNIFVGSGTFLYFHGVDYRGRESMLKSLYEEPESTFFAAADEYGITYVHIGHRENSYSAYNIDTAWFERNLECVYSSGSGAYAEKLYKVVQPQNTDK